MHDSTNELAQNCIFLTRKSLMERIDTNSSAELLKILSGIDISVPIRIKGRTTEDVEKYAIVRLLITYLNADRLEFPLSLSHRDKPDFLLLNGSHQIGIECTESIPEQYAWAHALWEEYFPDGFFQPSFFKWSAPQRSREEIIEILSKSQNKLHGSGWTGDGVEIDWANWMFECINIKTEKLNSNSFNTFESNYLLIYDNLPQVNNDLNKSTKFLFEKLNVLWKEKALHFDKIIIDSRNSLIGITTDYIENVQIPNIADI